MHAACRSHAPPRLLTSTPSPCLYASTLQQPPKVASRIQEDFKLATTDKLGTVRKLGAGDRNLPPDHAFGVTSLLNGKREPGVDVLLGGNYTQAQQQPKQ